MSSTVLARAEAYADDVLSGKRPSGKLERLAVERWKRDRAGCKYSFDPERAERVGKFLELLHHVVGIEAGRGERLTLLGWQCFIIANIFGWVDGDGYRRFRTAYIQVARGSGKSFLTAGLGLYMLTADGEEAPAVYIAATSAKQSKIIFDYVRGVVRKNEALRKKFGLIVTGGESRTGKVAVGDTLGQLTHLCRENEGSWDGFRPSLAVCDELHAHPKEDSWQALQGGMQTRPQPLMLGITTAGMKSEGIAYEKRNDLETILKGEAEDDRYFGMVYEPDKEDLDGDGWKHPDVWRKACPSLGESVSVAFYEEAAAEAERRPAKRVHFFVKHLNTWLSGSEAWIDEPEFESCIMHPSDFKQMKWDELAGRECYIGFDAASVQDLTSVCYLFEQPNGQFLVRHRNYTSEAQVLANEIYAKWVDDGWLTKCGNRVIDLDDVLAQLKKDLETYKVLAVGYDPHQGRTIAQALAKMDEDLLVTQFSQAGQWPSYALKEIEGHVKNGAWLWDGSPATQWCFRNARVQVSRSGYMSLDRTNRDLKVDAVDAACAAINARQFKLSNDEAASTGIAVVDWSQV